MEQRTHAWIPTRALALIEEIDKDCGLVKILKPCAKATAIGAWIPDLQAAKRGFGDLDYHVFKLEPFDGDNKERFVLKKEALLKGLGPQRATAELLRNDITLKSDFWDTPFKADPPPGQHLANQAMSLHNTIKDLLLLGDDKLDALVPGQVSFAHELHDNARSHIEQVATYLYMMTHFIADSCMPCHCDGRVLASFNGGKVHHELELYWRDRIDPVFDKDKLEKCEDSPTQFLDRARKVDAGMGLDFDASMPRLINGDVWKEMVMVCRGSFALSCIIAPPAGYPFGSATTLSFEDRFESSAQGEELLKRLTACILHDAVVNVAMCWMDIWDTFVKRP